MLLGRGGMVLLATKEKVAQLYRKFNGPKMLEQLKELAAKDQDWGLGLGSCSFHLFSPF